MCPLSLMFLQPKLVNYSEKAKGTHMGRYLLISTVTYFIELHLDGASVAHWLPLFFNKLSHTS